MLRLLCIQFVLGDIVSHFTFRIYRFYHLKSLTAFYGNDSHEPFSTRPSQTKENKYGANQRNASKVHSCCHKIKIHNE